MAPHDAYMDHRPVFVVVFKVVFVVTVVVVVI